ncbi:cytochrome P450 2U1 [Biomphalaria glabrata]|nr:cytochrome P450 2U1 [Biomphalaria glabrata]
MEFSAVDLALALCVVILLVFHFWLNGDSRRLPPSPLRPLPIVGNIFALISDQRSQFKQWREKCGDIFSLRIGSKFMVVLNGYDLIKEVLVQNADDFSDRPLTVFDLTSGLHSNGIITSSGKVWKEQRAVGLQILRNFGMGKNILADQIQKEIHKYIEYLSENIDHPVDIDSATNISSSNIICSILFGQRFEYSDQSFRKLMDNIALLINNFIINSSIVFIPALRLLPGDWFRIKQTERGVQEMFQLFVSCIEKCRKGETGECFISEYLKEQEKRVKSGIGTSMDDNNLKKVIFDLFITGSETTSTTLYWFVLYMLHYPDAQKRIFDEINEHVGTDRVPNIEDKPNLTYLSAAIMETQRLASIAPNGFIHTCPRDVTLRGYTIPKGAYVMPCLDSVLYDEKIWGQDVMSFRPERFIGHEGQLLTPEEFIPFGTGRRICFGKNMANVSMYLYVSNMIQKFEFQPVDPFHLPSTKYNMGLSVHPDHYQVKVVPRRSRN